MFEEPLSKYERIEEELNVLRQTIMKVEPAVMIDGRFEQMILNPIQIVRIAERLLSNKLEIEPFVD